MRRFLPFLMALTVLVACAPLSINRAGVSSTCANRVAHAMTSPDHPVTGAYACLDRSDSKMAAALDGANITSDESLATFAASEPVYTAYRECVLNPAPTGDAANYRYYELTGVTGTQIMRVHLTTKAKVDGIQFGGSRYQKCSDLAN